MTIVLADIHAAARCLAEFKAGRVLVEHWDSVSQVGDEDDSDDARPLRLPQTAASAYRNAFRTPAGQRQGLA